MLPVLYHAHHNQHLDDLPFWLKLAGQTGGSVLELGCGTGRVLLPLAKAGQQVVGIDRSLAMLKFAKSMAKEIDITPRLVAADIRRFHLNNRFSLIILPCNTYSTLDKEDRQSCLECVRQHLPAGGSFALSIPNPDNLRGLPACSKAEPEEEFLHPYSGNPVQVSSAWQRTRQLFIITWIYDHLLPDGQVERFSETVAHHLAPTAEYLDEIRSAKLEIIHLYGDFDCSEYSQDSPYLICVCSA